MGAELTIMEPEIAGIDSLKEGARNAHKFTKTKTPWKPNYDEEGNTDLAKRMQKNAE